MRLGAQKPSLSSFLILLTLVVPLYAAPDSDESNVAIRVEMPTAERLRLELGADVAASWREANVARLTLRQGGAEGQEARRLELDGLPDSKALDIELGTGCSLLLADLGPAEAKGHADAWRRVSHCVKRVVCRDALDVEQAGPKGLARILLDRLQAGAMLTEKTGSQAELRPLTNPATVRPGSDLVARLYVESAAEEGAMVEAIGPGGVARELRTDAIGVVVARIDRAGSWTLRHRDPTSGIVAELAFEVESAEFWDRLPTPREAARLLPASPSSIPENVDSPEKASGIVWTELGPRPLLANAATAGRASAIVTHPRRANSYFAAAASGGVWSSTNGGRSWTPLGDNLPIPAIGALALDPNDDRILYAGSGEANYAYHSLYGLGLYKSTNRGATWRVLAPEVFAGRTFSRLVVSPDDSRTIWAAVARAGGTFEGFEGARRHPRRRGPVGLFRSRDGGVTWEHLRARVGLPALAASDVDLHPTDPRRVYVSIGDVFGKGLNGIYLSTDRGNTFRRISDDLPGGQVGRITLDIAPTRPNRIYALLVNPTDRTNLGGFLPPGASTLGVARSDDGGATWTLFDPGNFQRQQGDYNATIRVHPEDPDTVFVGGVQMLRSRDAGATWEDITPLHVDLHDIEFDAAGNLLVADDGGIHRSVSLGDTWVSRSGDLGTIQIYAGLSIHPADSEAFLIGTQDNGTNLRLGNGNRWVSVLGGDGGYTAIRPDDPDVFFAQFQGTARLFRSNDGGASFGEANSGLANGDRTAFQAPFLLDPRDPDRMLYASHRIYESTDGGANWNPISGDLTAGDPAAVRSLTMAPANPDIVYAMTNDGRVLVSTDGGADWQLIRENVPGWPRVTRQLAVDPVRPAEVYVAEMGFGGDRVLRSPNRGRTWQPIGRNLPNIPVNTVAVGRDGQRRLVFAGTDAGVFLSRDLGRSWQIYGAGLPRVPVMDLVVDVDRDRLVASTLGRGVWSAPLDAGR